MNVLGFKMTVIEKMLAALVLLTLIAGAFPASYAGATSDTTISDLVMETEEGDLCDNMLGVQLTIPEGYAADGSACYVIDSPEPVYVIDGYKYECVFNSDMYEIEEEFDCTTPVEGWTIFARQGEVELTTTTDENGYYSFEVAGGNWEVSEAEEVYWEQIFTWEDGDVVESYSCDFNFGEIIEVARVADMGESSDGTCDFGNYHQTSPVVGTKWNDTNANGLKDEGENGIGGWTIIANDGDGRVVEVETEENGEYTLDLEPGVWTISEESRSGWDQIAVEQNGEVIEDTTCTFEIGYEYSKSVERKILDEEYTPSCSFFNDRERSGGSSSGTRVSDRPTPTVLGAATGTPACGMYLTEYMRMDSQASSSEVLKLQIFLNAVGIEVEMNGMFDAATDVAVRAFQATHKADVLTPWFMAKLVPHENPTGWVYQLTRWKINNMVCPGSEAYPVLN